MEKEPNDPWLVVPWGFASLGLAIVEADRGAADVRARVDSALAALARVEKEAHRDLWNDTLAAAARDLAQRLAGVR